MSHAFTDNLSSTDRLPKASRTEDFSRVQAALARPQHARADALLAASAGNAPYLAQLILKHPDIFDAVVSGSASQVWSTLRASQVNPTQEQPALMRTLRQHKAQAGLTIALADITSEWALLDVTGALTQLAEISVRAALHHLLLRAAAKGDLALSNPAQPEDGSGIIILGMGKLGGFELNYSSDIDLIVLFDKETLPYTGPKSPQHFMNKLASDLVAILEERTPDGYVFRTDLRLRPDPMSTPLAVSTSAALTYYETVGQNWERAAMIKARPIAGDALAAAHYMRELVPFIWRKTLDFATIADIHSIKRQMNVKAGTAIDLPGHNIKTGVGGIREIEFFVATQQLVWGGRIPELRVAPTLAALNALTDYELTTPAIRDQLSAHYHELRRIEHRMQMRHDEQTHQLPKDADSMRELAIFCGFDGAPAFECHCDKLLHEVHRIYTDSMQDSEPLAVDGNLVFTGVEADADTLATLARMGYSETTRISDIIQGWHRGHRRSTRSKRSRQVLTELVPALLTALSKTANPDAAFFHFDDFIGRLPSGAQIFSLFLSRPEMLSLLADILGSAPALGETLSKDPALLDSVLEADFFSELPTKEALEDIVTERLRFAHAYEQKMIYLRTFNNEKRFQAGVHLLKRIATPKRIGAFLSDVAEVVLQSTMQEVAAEYWGGLGIGEWGLGSGEKKEDGLPRSPQQVRGPRNDDSPASLVPNPQSLIPFCVVALGKLGGREMTFGSDLDITLVYDDPGDAASEARLHVSRISQRLISALTLLTREGRLYEVDTRLRPGGTDGPLAVTLAAFDGYFANNAWTYEHMALTRARVVATNHVDFATRVEETIRTHVLKPHEPSKLLADVVDMRRRIAKEYKTANPWALKHVRGGMVDLDFIAQYLILREANRHTAMWHRGARAVFETAQSLAILKPDTAEPLIAAKRFLSDLLSLLRLSAPGGSITDDAPSGLKRLLVDGMQVEDFDTLKDRVLAHEAAVLAAFTEMESANLT